MSGSSTLTSALYVYWVRREPPVPPPPVLVAPDPDVLAGRIYARWLPLHAGDADAGYPLGALAEALAVPLNPVDELVRESDTHPAWGTLWDVTAAPVWLLPWLA